MHALFVHDRLGFQVVCIDPDFTACHLSFSSVLFTIPMPHFFSFLGQLCAVLQGDTWL